MSVDLQPGKNQEEHFILLVFRKLYRFSFLLVAKRKGNVHVGLYIFLTLPNKVIHFSCATTDQIADAVDHISAKPTRSVYSYHSKPTFSALVAIDGIMTSA